MTPVDIYPRDFSEPFVQALERSARRMAQRGFAVNPQGTCEYRADSDKSGPACIVGGMINDLAYSPDIETLAATDVEVVGAVEQSIEAKLNQDEITALSLLQTLHDGTLEEETDSFLFTHKLLHNAHMRLGHSTKRDIGGVPHNVYFTPYVLRLAEKITRAYDEEREARGG